MQTRDETALNWDASMEDCLSRALRGERQAFAEIYERMYPAVTKYLFYKLGTAAEPEDVANDVFLAAWRSLPRFKGGHFPGWIFRIARNMAVGEIRKASRSRIDSTAPVMDGASSQPGPDVEAERSARREELMRALSRLKDEQREVVIMKFLLNMTNSEVSRTLGKSENAINSQQHRALKTLKKLLPQEGMSSA